MVFLPRKLSRAAYLLGALSLTCISNAQTLISANGATQAYQTGVTVVSSYTPNQASNSVLLLAYTFDTDVSGGSAATFGGASMTLLASNSRTAIYGLANPGASAGDIVLTTNRTADVMVTYGTLTGVDTSSFPLSSANGATFSSPTATMSSNLTGMSDGDFVFSIFNLNGAASFSSISGGVLATLNSYDVDDTATYSGGIFGGNISSGDLSGGNYTPTVTFTGVTGGSAIYGSAVSFTAVPEPGTYGLLLGIFGLTWVMTRRARARV